MKAGRATRKCVICCENSDGERNTPPSNCKPRCWKKNARSKQQVGNKIVRGVTATATQKVAQDAQTSRLLHTKQSGGNTTVNNNKALWQTI